ncbi:MAG: peptidoglycan DD-metalloendopeptidase family protein [Anaeroplasmataceae bacterium]
MKDKILNFIKDKRELIIFTFIIIAIFGSVIAIASIALKDSKTVPTIVPENPPSEDPPEDFPITYKMLCPVEGDYLIVRTFYDMSYDTVVLESAFIETDTTMKESKGVSYSGVNNESLNVVTVLPGKVIDIDETELYGNVVTIEHSDSIISRYRSLSSVSVNIGDELQENEVIGITGESLYDTLAKNHVHVELLSNGNYIDITKTIGKEASEVASMK